MAGYSGTPLVRKLGIKETHLVFLDGAPPDLDLDDAACARVVRRLPRSMDVTLTFHHDVRLEFGFVDVKVVASTTPGRG